MANQIGISLDINTDMSWYTHEIRKHFLDELCFCNDLPHVIDTDSHIYAHAAIMNETTFGDDFREVMTTHFFLNKNMHFHKKSLLVIFLLLNIVIPLPHSIQSMMEVQMYIPLMVVMS